MTHTTVLETIRFVWIAPQALVPGSWVCGVTEKEATRGRRAFLSLTPQCWSNGQADLNSFSGDFLVSTFLHPCPPAHPWHQHGWMSLRSGRFLLSLGSPMFIHTNSPKLLPFCSGLDTHIKTISKLRDSSLLKWVPPAASGWLSNKTGRAIPGWRLWKWAAFAGKSSLRTTLRLYSWMWSDPHQVQHRPGEAQVLSHSSSFLFVCFFTCDLGFWSHLLNFLGTEMIFPLSQTCMWFTSFDVLKNETPAIGERLLKAWLVAHVTHDSDWQVPKSCAPPDPPSGSKNN